MHITYGRRPEAFKPAAAAPVVSDNQTLISDYLAWKATHTRTAAKAYAIWVIRFQEFTNKAPEDLVIGDWTAFASSLAGRYAPKNVEFALNIVYNYLRFWHEQGRLHRFSLYLARVPTARARSHEPITEADYRRLVESLRAHGSLRDLMIVMMLHDTGMRLCEMARLELDQLQEDASAIMDTAKSKWRRSVFWNHDTDDVLQRYLIERINAGPDTCWVIPGQVSGRHMTGRNIERIVKAAVDRAGLKSRITPHSFRHGFIHRMSALGTPDAIIAQLVGHKTPQAVAHYTHLSRPEGEWYARRQFAAPALAA